MKDAEVTAGATLVSGDDTIVVIRGGTLEPYNGPSCAKGPGWNHYEIDGGQFLEDNMYGTKNPSCGGEYITPFHIETMSFSWEEVRGYVFQACGHNCPCNILSAVVPLWCHQVYVKISGYQESIQVGALADGRDNVLDG